MYIDEKDLDWDKPIARVNGEDILRKDLYLNLYRQLLFEYAGEEEDITAEEIRNLKMEVMEWLIDRLLLIQEAKRREIKVSEEEIYEELEYIKRNFESDVEFEEFLQELNATEEELKEEIRRDLLVDKLIDEEMSGYSFDDEVLKNFYEENKKFIREANKYKYIELLITEGVDEDELTSIKELLVEGNLEKLKELESVEEIIDNRNVFISETKIAPWELELLDELKEGEIGVKGIPDYGTIMIKLEKKQLGKTPSFEETKDELRDFLKDTAKKEVREKLLAELFEKADIVFFTENF